MSDLDDNRDENVPKRRRIASSLYWLGTFNNYAEQDLAVLLRELNDKTEMFAMQEETGAAGTPHLQLKLKLLKAGRPLETFTCKLIHWEKSRKWKGYEYCFKDDTNTGRRWGKGVDIPEPLKCPEMRGWQLKVLEMLKEDPDDRGILWLWETEGNFGKSSFIKYLCMREKAICVSGKASDIKCALQLMKKDGKPMPRIVCLDVPRVVEHVSYAGLEEIKNGCFCSPKYESGMVLMNSPHIVVCSNTQPDFSKWSSDRFHVFNVRELN